MVGSVQGGNYNEWITSLNSRGIKTTGLGSAEANFADYTGALSESLKQEIASSFDCQADYDLQAQLAGLYGSKSVMQSGDIVGAAKKAGIQVDVQYVNTSYIVDNKKGGKYANNKNATNGAIAVYTFKDANGGEIKIADANGNGALETEELFMNELLSGVVSDISASGGGASAGGIQDMQNNMQNKIDELLAQLQTQIEEQQKMIEKRAQALQEQLDNNTNKTADNKETETEIKSETKTKDKDNTYETEKEAEKYLRNNYPELSDTQIAKYLDNIMEKIEDTDLSVERAAKAVLKGLEELEKAA